MGKGAIRKILEFLQEDLPLESSPYRSLSLRTGASEDEIVRQIKVLNKRKIIRRFGAILNHHKIGFKANCMCVWQVPKAKITRAARLARAEKFITHCYLRNTQKRWPYNFYTMVHGRNRAECEKIIKSISKFSGIKNYQMLFTLKEFKKVSPKYTV